jgi:hypothetical protein
MDHLSYGGLLIRRRLLLPPLAHGETRRVVALEYPMQATNLARNGLACCWWRRARVSTIYCKLCIQHHARTALPTSISTTILLLPSAACRLLCNPNLDARYHNLPPFRQLPTTN